MKELIDHIPFIDLLIVGGLVFFIYLGWKHGLPRLAMTLGSIYVGFLLASIYYHLFGVALAKILTVKSQFVADFIAFLALNCAITLLMMGLLFSIFGHIEVTGRWEAFGKLSGSICGVLSALLIAGITITLLRAPYEYNKYKFDSNSGMPVVELFDDGYSRSAIAPLIVKSAPYLASSVAPMLPPGTREKGVVPLLEPIVSAYQKQQ